MAAFEVAQVIVGVAVLGAVVLPRLLSDQPLSFPMIYVAGGIVIFLLPHGVPAPDPVGNPAITERLTEFVVIIALTGAGLKLDRPFEVGAWSTTWRLLAVAMPLTIVLTAALGLWVFGTILATAILFGAVVAPTDPVLASDVQASRPLEGVDEEIDPAEQEGTVRFALTSEAGLNDGLAFPFTNLAIAAAAASLNSSSYDWLAEWFLVDVVYQILAGILVGYVSGRVMAWFIFGRPAATELARAMEGAEVIAVTLITYGVTELLGGYGFIAVFVAALEMRHYEWESDYHVDLHDVAVMVERLVMAAVLVLLGGAVAGGLLAPLTPLEVGVGLVVLLVVRPLAGVVGLLGSSLDWAERLVVATFGIRGIGSFYYLAHALNEASFREAELLVAADRLWALVGFIVLASIVLHGVSVSTVMDRLEARG